MKKESRLLRGSKILLVFMTGCLVGAAGLAPLWAKGDVYGKLDIFAKVLHYVETNYVDEVNPDDLVYGAVKGMLDTLDPHTVFMPPDVYREMKIDTTGEFQGVGLVVESRDSRLVVLEPIEGTPAYEAGILRGDVIRAIDGKPTDGMDLAAAVELMRGPMGTVVTLSIERPGLPKTTDFALTRGRIHMSSVEPRLLDGNIGYLLVKSFQNRTAAQMDVALKRLMAESKGRLAGLVLDLRDNPGGLLDEAVKMADEFLTDGLIVSTVGRNKNHAQEDNAHPSGAYAEGPLAILVNGASASAAEIVAGALQDHRRASVIGTRSFGKGSVQNIIELEDGSGLKITVARYYTPSGRSIEGEGVRPDIVVVQPLSDEETAVLAEEAEAREEAGIPPSPPETTDERGKKLVAAAGLPAGVDPADQQLLAAFAYLRAETSR